MRGSVVPRLDPSTVEGLWCAASFYPSARGVVSMPKKKRADRALVGVLGGSTSDFPILEKAAALLNELGIPNELLVVSAHRTPDRLFAYAEQAVARGIQVIIAGAGGAAHLPGMVAAKTLLPVIGVPIPTEHLRGLDSLLSIVQMPRGIPVATVAIGGAENAAILAAQILGVQSASIRHRLERFRTAQTHKVLDTQDDARLSPPFPIPRSTRTSRRP